MRSAPIHIEGRSPKYVAAMVSEELAQRIDRLAQTNNASRSSVIRAAIRAGLDRVAKS